MGNKKKRIESLLAQEIPLIVQQLNDPRLGFITITSVSLSNDFRYAKVSFSALGYEGDEEPERRISMFENVLNHSAPAVQKEIAEKLDLRYTPQLTFVFSEGLRKSIEMAALIKKARAGDPDHIEGSDSEEEI
jgi:ribosome-binding factor A